MYDQDRGKALSLGAIVALVGLVIAVMNAHSLFPELREYRENYNQFIFEYTTFAKNISKEMGIFNRYLQKADEL